MQGKSGARITFAGYRSDIDRFLSERMHDPNAPCPLKQKTPARILEIVEFLSKSTLPGRAAIASYLLDLDGHSRAGISNSIDGELAGQPTLRRARPFSTHCGVNLTVFCWTDGWAPRNAPLALEHARTVLLLHADSQRLLLELGYTDAGSLKEIAWQWVDLAAIPRLDLPRLRSSAGQLREARLRAARLGKGKIGRNDPCPCGSGKKYKRCCLARA